MTITIEMIDELRRRANVSFESAKKALENCNGDLVDALIYLEKQNKIQDSNKEKEKFSDKVKELIKKANNTKFIISKNGGAVLNFSLTIAILLGVFAFHVSTIALVLALVTGHRVKLESNNDDYTKANEVFDKVSDNIDTLKKKFNEDDETAS